MTRDPQIFGPQKIDWDKWYVDHWEHVDIHRYRFEKMVYYDREIKTPFRRLKIHLSYLLRLSGKLIRRHTL